jgi:hypothetical protein
MPITIAARKHCNSILQQSKETALYSEGFKNLIQILLPKHGELMDALTSGDRDQVVGYLTSAYHSLKWKLADENYICDMLETDDASRLLTEAYTMRAIGILQLRCLDAKQKSPID